jgi:hypothetical protein
MCIYFTRVHIRKKQKKKIICGKTKIKNFFKKKKKKKEKEKEKAI